VSRLPTAGVPTIKLVVIALAIGVGIKLVALAGVALVAGIEAARPLMFPGLGLVLGALAFPFVRRHYAGR
jgi:hypothetical protein